MVKFVFKQHGYTKLRNNALFYVYTLTSPNNVKMLTMSTLSLTNNFSLYNRALIVFK